MSNYFLSSLPMPCTRKKIHPSDGNLRFQLYKSLLEELSCYLILFERSIGSHALYTSSCLIFIKPIPFREYEFNRT